MKDNEKSKKTKLANSILGGGGIKNKNAFTLIELLAIIVILAIIAVITVPIILNVIDNAKKGSIKDSAYGYKDAVNKYYVSELYDNGNLKLNGDYTITDKGELSDGTNTYPIQVSGTTPTGGNLTYENNVLKNGCITIDEYKATIENGEVTTVEKGSCTSEKEQLLIGDSVSYVTSLNGVTLDNWKVFYVDGDYTYLIYGDYLPNEAISDAMKTTYNLRTRSTYNVGVTVFNQNTRQLFLNALVTKSNWDSLLVGTINGHSVNEISNENIWALGAPTIDLWTDSWNSFYPDDNIYISYVSSLTANVNYGDGNGTISLNYDGWYVGYTPNPTSPFLDISDKSGYNNTLYFLDQSDSYLSDNECNGYWLASPSADGPDDVVAVTITGDIYRTDYDYAFRPVIKFPSRVLNQ